MSIVDYGAVVKKNGKIITDPKGDLFQNYSNLKYEPIDETIITYKRYDLDTCKLSDEIESYSMGGNMMALIGDEQFLIGFYKQDFTLALNKVMIQYSDAYTTMWEWFDKHKKPFVIKLDNIPELSDIVISLVNRNLDYLDKFFAKFTYKGDKYEVLFGYGVDPNPKYLYGKQSYFYHHKERYYYNGLYSEPVHTFPGRVINKEDRRSLNIIKKWYEASI